MCQATNLPFLYRVDHQTKTFYWLQPNCKRWSCPDCAQDNKRMWSHRVGYGADQLIKQGEELDFLTLTCNRWQRGTEKSKASWQKNWPKLYNRMKRRKGSTLYYAMFPELHKDGSIHAHAIINTNFGTRWWKDNAHETGLGYMAEEEAISSIAYAIWYAQKYIQKAIERENWPKGLRRANLSRNWPMHVSGEKIQHAWITETDATNFKWHVQRHIIQEYTIVQAN